MSPRGAGTGGRPRDVVAGVALVVLLVTVPFALSASGALESLPDPWPAVVTVAAFGGVLAAVGVPYGRAVARSRAAEQSVVTAERPAWAAERGWTFTPGGPVRDWLAPLVLPHVARPGGQRDSLDGRSDGREVLVTSLSAKVPQRAGGAAVLDARVEAVSVTTRRRLPVLAATDGRWPEPRWRAPAVVGNVPETDAVPGGPAGLRWRLDAGAVSVLPAVTPGLAGLVGTRDAVVVTPDRVTVYGLAGRRRGDAERRLALALAVAEAAESASGGPVA